MKLIFKILVFSSIGALVGVIALIFAEYLDGLRTAESTLVQLSQGNQLAIWDVITKFIEFGVAVFGVILIYSFIENNLKHHVAKSFVLISFIGAILLTIFKPLTPFHSSIVLTVQKGMLAKYIFSNFIYILLPLFLSFFVGLLLFNRYK